MVMDATLRPGTENTLMSSMGSREEQAANTGRPEVYLPRVATSVLQDVSSTEATVITVDDAAAAPALTAEERAAMTLTVQPGSAIGEDGQPLQDVQIGIATVPAELVRDMLPPGVLQHTFDITIQAPGVAAFAEPVQITFPNVFNAAPGTKLNILSFDHTTGRLVINGTGTVSADGLTVTSDQDSGVRAPGWHGMAPAGVMDQCFVDSDAPLADLDRDGVPDVSDSDDDDDGIPDDQDSGEEYNVTWSVGFEAYIEWPSLNIKGGIEIPQKILEDIIRIRDSDFIDGDGEQVDLQPMSWEPDIDKFPPWGGPIALSGSGRVDKSTGDYFIPDLKLYLATIKAEAKLSAAISASASFEIKGNSKKAKVEGEIRPGNVQLELSAEIQDSALCYIPKLGNQICKTWELPKPINLFGIPTMKSKEMKFDMPFKLPVDYKGDFFAGLEVSLEASFSIRPYISVSKTLDRLRPVLLRL